MNAKSVMVTAVGALCLMAGPAFAQQGTGSGMGYGAAGHVTQVVPRGPQFQGMPWLILQSRHSGRVADAFSAAYAASPSAILRSREGQANIVLSDVPVHACEGRSRAAFALDKSGDIVSGCETSAGDHFSVCWEGVGCRTYESSKWDMVALSKPQVAPIQQ